MIFESTKILELGSCAFRQWKAQSHCKFIHGYRLVAKFYFGCSALDERNWVVDFGGLKELKNILEKQFDHTLCVAGDDPLLDGFKSMHTAGGCDLRIMPEGVGIEKTAEWCLKNANNFIRSTTNNRCWVNKVEVWEHEKNSAIVTAVSTDIPGVVTEQNTATQPPVNHVRNFLNEVEKESGVNITNVLKQIPPDNSSVRPAPVGNKITTGYSNLFGGTSWGT
jgi:6-pyruvoyltetrahydropterin/6-carboxytetrahydropterin synthase